ncbi:MAG: GGDEF domain-containing protein [Bacilli bacterium]|nr:GGDEF domain-containing protein [Bacilli bacterium]
MAKKRFEFKIQLKAILLILSASVVVVLLATGYFAIVTHRTTESEYKKNATSLSATVSQVVDTDKVSQLKNSVKTIVDNSPDKPLNDEMGSERWNRYIAQFDWIQEEQYFIDLKLSLAAIDSVNEVADCIYLGYVDPVEKLFVYLVDSAVEDACPPGTLDRLYEVNYAILTNPKRGFPAYTSNTQEYGDLVTAGAPIMLGEEVIGYSMVDISMTTVHDVQRSNIVSLFVLLVATMAILALGAIVVVHFVFVAPVTKLNRVAKSYDLSNPNKTHEVFQNTKIKTYDEIQDLSETISKLESDIHEKIGQLTKTNQDLIKAKEETEKMTLLANKDSLTGVSSKVAYDNDVAEINEAISKKDDINFGVVMIDLNDLKVINDDYGHMNGDVALIKLSDLITRTFSHSKVYRVGGDEFVVILRNKDYVNSAEMINEFNLRISAIAESNKLSAAEKTIAAIGYSEFNPETDTSVEDVFKRADLAMYERKRIMKNKK